MLGRLATWLRLVGADTTYGSHLSGRTLIRQARMEGRTILTRDRHLLRLGDLPPVLFITSDHFRDQLRQVVASAHLEPLGRLFTRCSHCNEPVVPVCSAEVASHVPAYVASTQERFVRCPRCARIYWAATHYHRVCSELRAMGIHIPATIGG